MEKEVSAASANRDIGVFKHWYWRLNKKDEYLFKDIEKFQNIAVLEAIYASSLSKKSVDVESFN